MSVRKPPIHTVAVDGGWAIEIEGEHRLGRVAPTRHEAVAAGRLRARRDKTEHIIHRDDGKIIERQNYGARSERSGKVRLDGASAESRCAAPPLLRTDESAG